jgi:hypothetical protein
MDVTNGGRLHFTPRGRSLHRYLLATQQQCAEALATMIELVTTRSDHLAP